MKIAVLGATGKTGSQVVDQALAAGDEVVAFVRRPEAVTARAGLTVVGGQLTDQAALTGAIRGCDAVVVALGPSSLKGVTIMQTALPAVTAAMKATGVERLVVLSAFGVGKTAAKANPVAKLGFKTLLKSVYADHHAAESQLTGSGLKWTTVHPGLLTDGPLGGSPRVADIATMGKVSGAPRVSRADVAAVLLQVVGDDQTVWKQIFVG